MKILPKTTLSERLPLKVLPLWIIDFFKGERNFLPSVIPLRKAERIVLILFDGLARGDFKKYTVSFSQKYSYYELWNEVPNTRSAMNQIFSQKLPKYGKQLHEVLRTLGKTTCFIDRYVDVHEHGLTFDAWFVAKSDEHAAELAYQKINKYDFLFFHQFERDNVYHGKTTMTDQEAINRIVERINKILDKTTHDPHTLVIVFSDHGPHKHPTKKLKEPTAKEIKKIKRLLAKGQVEIKTCPTLLFW